ncbi:hypothetical protein KC342_g28 [Hortaea werneckii]|nr:hypothetical protein KC342_g28 [Hortaea werneckii]
MEPSAAQQRQPPCEQLGAYAASQCQTSDKPAPTRKVNSLRKCAMPHGSRHTPSTRLALLHSSPSSHLAEIVEACVCRSTVQTGHRGCRLGRKSGLRLRRLRRSGDIHARSRSPASAVDINLLQFPRSISRSKVRYTPKQQDQMVKGAFILFLVSQLPPTSRHTFTYKIPPVKVFQYFKFGQIKLGMSS